MSAIVMRQLSRGRNRRQHQRRRGLGLVEALISLAIVATLLTAVAAAYSASTRAIEVNDQFSRATQAARVTVNYVMADVRKSISGVLDADSLELTMPSGDRHIYRFDAVARQLTLTLPDDPGAPTRVMARNVQNVSFVTEGQTTCLNVTIQIGDNRITLSGSAMPRRTMSYN
jgi:Tfp pilus assembly protein PilW